MQKAKGRTMRVAVCGLGTLGTVAAHCLAEAGFDVVAWHPDSELPRVAEKLPNSTFPIVNNAKTAVTNADAIWLAFDTPLGGDKPDTEIVERWASQALTEASPGQLVLVSSQLPVGSVRKMSDKYTHLKFFCSPENLRTGSAVENFKNPGRVIIGTPDYPNEVIASIFAPFCKNLFWCSIESAEFAKHALNATLAAQIALTNELGQVAIKHGASPGAIEYALRTDERMSSKGYYAYGKGGLGQHLARDVRYLLDMAPELHVTRGIQRANDDWKTTHGR